MGCSGLGGGAGRDLLVRVEAGGSFEGFHVDEDIGDGGFGLADCGFDLAAEDMGIVEGEEGIGLDVEVDVVFEAEFSDAEFFGVLDARDVSGGGVEAIEQGGVGRAVHEVVDGGTEDAEAVECDDEGGDERGPVVGGFPAFSFPDGDGDADEGGDGGDGIGAVVPGIGLDGGGAEGVSDIEDAAKEGFLDEDDGGEDDECEGSGCVVGGDDLTNGGGGDADGRAQEHESDDGGDEGFGLAVAVGVG